MLSKLKNFDTSKTYGFRMLRFRGVKIENFDSVRAFEIEDFERFRKYVVFPSTSIFFTIVVLEHKCSGHAKNCQNLSKIHRIFGALEHEMFGASKALLSTVQKTLFFANFDSDATKNFQFFTGFVFCCHKTIFSSTSKICRILGS